MRLQCLPGRDVQRSGARRRRFLLTLAGCFAFTVLCSPAMALDLDVPSDRNPTLRRAMKRARTGDRIVIAPGVYDERPCAPRRPGVTVVGDGVTWRWTGRRARRLRIARPNTTFQGIAIEGVNVLVRADNCVLDGVTISGSGDTALVELRGSGATLTGCTVEHTPVRTRRSDTPSILASGSGATITGCAISLPGVDETAALRVVGGSAQIVSNTFFDGGAGVVIEGPDAHVRANTIRLVSGVGIDIDADGADCADNDVAIVVGTGLRATGNAVWVQNNSVAVGGDGAGLPTRDPPVSGYSAYGIVTAGDRCLVLDNSVLSNEDRRGGIYVDGRRSVVIGNRVGWAAGPAIEVAGTGHTVTFNRAWSTVEGPRHGSGIVVGGSFQTVTDNVTTAFDTGLFVGGTDGTQTIARHEASGGTLGIRVATSGLRIVDCVVFDHIHGVLLEGDDCVLEGLDARDGQEGVMIAGADCRIENSAVVRHNPYPVSIRGARAQVIDCLLTGVGDSGWGVHVDAAVDTLVERCVLDEIGAHGFVIQGATRTTVRECEIRSPGSVGVQATLSTDLTLDDVVIDGAGEFGLDLRTSSNVSVLRCSILGSGTTDVVGADSYAELLDNVFGTGGF